MEQEITMVLSQMALHAMRNGAEACPLLLFKILECFFRLAMSIAISCGC